MRITIESTTKTVELNGVPARVWEGTTDSGIPVHCFVTRVMTLATNDLAQFEAELQSCRQAHNPDIDAIPNRLIL